MIEVISRSLCQPICLWELMLFIMIYDIVRSLTRRKT